MYPILFRYGSFLLPSWHAMYAIGAMASLWLFVILAGKNAPGVTWPQLSRVFAICYVAGYFGARLLSILIEEPEVTGIYATVLALFKFGPMTFYGGALAAALCGSIYVAINRLPLGDLFDCAIPAGLLALGIGRVGCFLNGDDFGKAVPLATGESPPFWAVTLPNLGDQIPRYPVQLMESSLALLLCLACIATHRSDDRKAPPGLTAILGIGGYATIRFLLEYLRDDFRGTIPWTQLSTSQGISLALVTIVAFALLRVRRAN